ncbi:peptide/nickel transport system permease protein [Propionibacterium cyclohexanicum]|uniref:Peptide/nickel transport system permease protein n=1 Tax=Propionibacterium cyclohexanicum TaxID=64702 RepID=A0A1H9RME6_9ACTN|nr:ABC transporter permease [Propionibacterium cyclohexanicum]SER73738.1 peptide/nickel transport system permease protein [Propionibacterium cyclohexanicum]
MVRFIVRRVIISVFVLLAISLCVYLIFYSSTVDPARVICGRPCQPERLTQIHQLMDIDKPAFAQWLDFVKGLFVGRTFGTGPSAMICSAPCLGYSFDLRQSVTSLIVARLPITASIAVGGAVLALFAGMASGILAARHRNRLPDHLVRGSSLVLLATPTYLLGLIAILVFGFWLNMVPVSGYVPFGESPVEWLWHLVLPWCVIAALSGSSYARYARNQMLDELGAEHLLALRATGASPRTVGRTARRGVWVPIITLFGLDLAGLLGGAVFTERVFGMHGIGDLLIDGVGRHDLGVVVGTALFGAALIIAANLVVDIAYGFIDPRVRRG